jgi:hypothetical protein
METPIDGQEAEAEDGLRWVLRVSLIKRNEIPPIGEPDEMADNLTVQPDLK